MKLNNSTLKLVITLIVLAGVAVGIYFSLPAIVSVAGYLLDLFLPFVLGYLFSILVNPLADFLQKKLKIPRGMSAVLVIILILGVLGSVVTVLIMKIIDEVRNVYAQFPSIYQSIQNDIENWKQMFSGVYDRMPENIQLAMNTLGDTLSDKVAVFINTKSSPMVSNAGSVAKALPKILIGFVVFILSSFFMVSDPKTVSGFVNKVFPERFMKRMHIVGKEIRLYLGGYCKAQLTIMSIVFVILFAGLTLFGVEYALLIALGIAFLDALPFFGSGAALWPWALVNFINGDIRMGIGLMVLYVIIIMTRQFIEPKIVSSNIGMNSLLTLMSMYIGYKTLSIGGMILGPITLMLIISFYKAGVFDGIIRLLIRIKNFLIREFTTVKNKIKDIWEG